MPYQLYVDKLSYKFCTLSFLLFEYTLTNGALSTLVQDDESINDLFAIIIICDYKTLCKNKIQKRNRDANI